MRHSTLLTEFTDISQRLEYLVAHSSQLVFVTGEDAAVQQGFVEAFLGQQSNSANVAFLSAKRGKNNQYYRQQLAEQLFLKTSRNQSFVQAFTAREDKSQPVIIAITSAENIPEEVLRELWDLVLQNRFTRNGEQVNILMFGEHEWAEEVKSWLPTNNNDKPVLLTTQTLEYNEETEVEGDLDDLIASRRKLFQQRMQARAQNDTAEHSILSTWWFRLGVTAVFLSSFSSLLIWQYFDVTESALKEFAQFLFQEEAITQDTNSQEVPQDALEANTTDINQRVAANFTAAMESIESVNSQSGNASTDAASSQSIETQAVKVNTFSQQSADYPNSEYIADISAEQLKQLRDSGTISAVAEQTTASAVAANKQTAQEQVLQASILDALNELDAISLEPDESPTEPDEGLTEPDEGRIAPINSPFELVSSDTGRANGPEGTNRISKSDTSASVRTQPPETATLTAQVSDAIAITETPRLVDNSIPQDPAIASAGDSGVTGDVNDFQVEDETLSAVEDTTVPPDTPREPVYQYHEPILLQLPNDSYVLQISGITTESLLQEFLVDNRLLNSVWVYKTQRYGGDWFVILLNQSFDTLPQARNAVSLLSEDLQAVEPFAKSMATIRNEILQ